MGVCVPEEYGGAGADFLSYVLVLEELSRADAGVGVTVAVHTSACTLPILAFGTDEQKERFVPPLARGETLGAFALTEPDSGSDAGALRTTAAARTTAGGSAARSSGSRTASTRARSCSSPAPTPRLEGAAGIRRSSSTASTSRSRATRRSSASTRRDERPAASTRSSPADRLLHEERKGFTVAMATLDGGRIGIAAQAVGIAQAAYDAARAYALERRAVRQADRPTSRRSSGSSRTWRPRSTRRACSRSAPPGSSRRASRTPAEGAKAKLFASEMARRQTAEAIQMLGGYGYTKEFPVERYYRDAKITEIYEGTSEIQRIVIARWILARAEAAVATQDRRAVRLTRIYTRGGDAGETSLGDGSRVSKLDCRIGAFGTVDELNAAIGVVLAGDCPEELADVLERVQNELFDVGADLSVPWGVTDRLRVEQALVDRLEADCDRFNAELPELRSFVLPGGTETAARLHVARTTCRRAERTRSRLAERSS